MSGCVQEIRYINRDENTPPAALSFILLELRKKARAVLRRTEPGVPEMIRQGVEQEIEWGCYVIGGPHSRPDRGDDPLLHTLPGKPALHRAGPGAPLRRGGKGASGVHEWISQYSTPT